MKRAANKSHCPINYALEAVGDSWSLLIVRDIVFWGKSTFGEFLESDEAISSNILSKRLAHLEQQGILVKKAHPSDGRREIYMLSEKGLRLVPILLEMSGWSSQYDPQTTAAKDYVAKVYANRTKMFQQAINLARKRKPLFEKDIKSGISYNKAIKYRG